MMEEIAYPLVHLPPIVVLQVPLAARVLATGIAVAATPRGAAPQWWCRRTSPRRTGYALGSAERSRFVRSTWAMNANSASSGLLP